MEITRENAQNDLLTCAAYLAGKIKSADGYAHAISEILPLYLAKKEVDISADLADGIEEPFVRDQMLLKVAAKCAEIDDDEYALQLSEAIEDFSYQSLAKEAIIGVKANKKEFEKAFDLASALPDETNALLIISGEQEIPAAIETIEKIAFPFAKTEAYLRLFAREKDASLLEKAAISAEEIEFDEEKARALNNISIFFIEAERKDRAIEILSKAQEVCERLSGNHRDNFLSLTSLHFFAAGSTALADRCLDLVSNPQQISSTLLGFSQEYLARKEEEEALESLDEAYAILKSQRIREVRDSQSRYELMARIAVHYAALGKNERAIEAAAENEDEDFRNYAYSQIAQFSALQGKDDISSQSLNLIESPASKASAMLAISEIYKRKEDAAAEEDALQKASALCDEIIQPSPRSSIYNRIAIRLGKNDASREIASKSLKAISEILDESLRAAALGELSEAYNELDFQLSAADKELLEQMIRKTER